MYTLRLKNAGLLKEAEVEFGGLTVIAGLNDVGKSFIGKTLFAIINSLNQAENDFIQGRNQKIQEEVGKLRRLFYEIERDRETGKNFPQIRFKWREFLNSLDESFLFDAPIEIIINEIDKFKKTLVELFQNDEKHPRPIRILDFDPILDRKRIFDLSNPEYLEKYINTIIDRIQQLSGMVTPFEEMVKESFLERIQTVFENDYIAHGQTEGLVELSDSYSGASYFSVTLKKDTENEQSSTQVESINCSRNLQALLGRRYLSGSALSGGFESAAQGFVGIRE